MRSAHARPPVVRFCAASGLLAAASVLGSAGMAAAQTPTFVNVANSGQSAFAQARQFSTPSLNDNGQTAFRVGFGGDFAFYRGNAAGGATMVASSVFDPLAVSSNTFSGFDATDINDAGTIAFTSYRNDGPGPEDRMAIHTIAVGGPLTVVADNVTNYSGVGQLDLVSFPQVNDNGTVAFAGSSSGNFRLNGIYRSPAPGQVMAVTQYDIPTQSGVQPQRGISLNNADDVAFQRNRFAGGPSYDGVYVADALATTAVGQLAGQEAPGATIALLAGDFDLNDVGTVLLAGRPSGGSTNDRQLYLATAGTSTLTPVVGPAAGGAPIDGSFALGEDASVAFRGHSDRALYIVAAPGAAATRLLGPGDALFGSTLVDFHIRPGALNADGSIAFNYELANGTIGVAVALVPEPTSLAALAVAALVGLRRRRRRRGERSPLTSSRIAIGTAALLAASALPAMAASRFVAIQARGSELTGSSAAFNFTSRAALRRRN